MALDASPHVAFWSRYQPGLQLVENGRGTSEVRTARYALEPDIIEMARFSEWTGKNVLEIGCGIGTDAVEFVRNGARYTGVDFSPTAVAAATRRLGRLQRGGVVVQASADALPFQPESFDLVYSNGVLHHIQDVGAAVAEMSRVLRPRGVAVAMLYHGRSINYCMTIRVVRRVLAPILLIPGGINAVHALTKEPEERLVRYSQRLREEGPRYLLDRSLFVSESTDGPDNPLSRVYSEREAQRLFSDFSDVRTAVRYLNLRSYPCGSQMSQTSVGNWLERRVGWHLWVTAMKRERSC
jgi:SAM-dependent methyltransferase